MDEQLPDLTYRIKKYNWGYVGKCVEIPSIIAQAEAKEQLDKILDDMTKEYLSILRQKSIPKKEKDKDTSPLDTHEIIETRPIPQIS